MINRNTQGNHLTKLFASLLASLAFISPASAGVFENHKNLWETLGKLGVETHINNPEMCDGDNDGAYYPHNGDFVVCQDNATGTTETTWTANDLDTIRHEAFHVLQDCLDGFEKNSTLTPYHSPDGLVDFLTNSSLSVNQVESIANHYRSQGADNHVVFLELEAFAAADSLSATAIANLLKKHCTW